MQDTPETVVVEVPEVVDPMGEQVAQVLRVTQADSVEHQDQI